MSDAIVKQFNRRLEVAYLWVIVLEIESHEPVASVHALKDFCNSLERNATAHLHNVNVLPKTKCTTDARVSNTRENLFMEAPTKTLPRPT
jgi:hypothetical protein